MCEYQNAAPAVTPEERRSGLDVVVERELHRRRVHAQRVDLVGALVGEPHVEDVLGEVETSRRCGHAPVNLCIDRLIPLSILSLMSYNVIGEVDMGGRNFNDIMDYFSNQILLPLGGLLIAVFAGWVMTNAATRDELLSLGPKTYALWHFMIRFVVPPAVLVIFVMGIAW